MKRKLIMLMVCLLSIHLSAQETIDLLGAWDFAIGDTARYADYVMLPGSTQTNGKGEWVGKAWYKKDFYVPQSCEERHVDLFLERVNGGTVVRVNGEKVDQQASYTTPHTYDVTPYIRPGGRNRVEVCVDNSKEGAWNGIVGKMELQSHPQDLYIKKVRIFPYPFAGTVLVDVTLGGRMRNYAFGVMEAVIQRVDNDSADVSNAFFEVGSEHVGLTMSVGNEIALWDEFHPTLYRLGLILGEDYYETTFGMREIAVSDSLLMTNQRPFYLRGTVENGHFPKTGFVPTDEFFWERMLGKVKKYGLNMMRFRSYCPPETAFAVADRMGLYLQPDIPTQKEEAERIVDTYGNHPSFLMLPKGSGPVDGDWVVPLVADDYKAAIERQIGTKDFTGFLLHDLTGTGGTAISCGPIVPLAKFPKTVYTSADTLVVPISAYNAYYGDLKNASATYYIHDDSMKVLSGGRISNGILPIGKDVPLGVIRVPLDSVQAPTKLTLCVQMVGRIKNQWEFQVLPAEEKGNLPTEIPDQTIVADEPKNNIEK